MFQKQTIAMKKSGIASDPFTYCYVFKGQSYSGLKRLDAFMKEIRESGDIKNALLKHAKIGKVPDSPLSNSIRAIVSEVF